MIGALCCEQDTEKFLRKLKARMDRWLSLFGFPYLVFLIWLTCLLPASSFGVCEDTAAARRRPGPCCAPAQKRKASACLLRRRMKSRLK